MSGASTTNGSPVRPDRQTKAVFGIAYTFSMAVVGFLALQVWLLNGRMERIEAQQQAATRIVEIQIETQKEWNQRIERLLDRLTQKVDALTNDKR